MALLIPYPGWWFVGSLCLMVRHQFTPWITLALTIQFTPWITLVLTIQLTPWITLVLTIQLTPWITLALTIQLTTVDYHRSKRTFLSHYNSLETQLNNSVFSSVKPLRVSFV